MCRRFRDDDDVTGSYGGALFLSMRYQRLFALMSKALRLSFDDIDETSGPFSLTVSFLTTASRWKRNAH